MPKKEYWDNLWSGSPALDKELEKYKNQYLTPEIFNCMSKYCTKRGIKWLEAGCGPGFWNFLFSNNEKIDFSVGVDISDCLTQAQAYKIENKIEPVHFIKGDILKLPFPDESFDFITSLGVIEHFDNPQIPLLEMRRVLKKGGILFLDTPNRGLWSLWNRFFPIDEHEDYYSPDELRAIAQKCDLEVIEYYAKAFSNSVMTILYNIYDYREDCLLSRGYHFGLNYVKQAVSLFDSVLDNKHGFYSIIIARKR